ncbi:MAG: pyridoxal phosphate-dependent aminotransferase, partial [Candidatus Cloacimonadota bacterium]|nr:pyridoxal phosphate-dependent aminotransferase [Candidatus Cloacimonadota bacterium]
MGIKISNRAKAIKPSPTMAVSALANKMKARGIDVINFGVGEPDYDTPDYIKEAGKKAIDDNFTRYTASSGILELREAISVKLKNDNDIICDPQDILVSPGAKASIINVLMAICDPRDEVIIPSPCWVSYTSQVGMVDALPKLMRTTFSTKFKITPKQLEDKIAELSNPKALILNSPNNPTGTIYSRKTLEKIAEICLKNNILIISDEIYEKLIYDGKKHCSVASISNEVRENTVLINGVSKAYAMTGWRLGYCAGPKEIIKKASSIQAHTTSCVNSMTQKAAVAALTGENNRVIEMRDKFQERRNYLVEKLNEIEFVKCPLPKGAFYAFPYIKYYLTHNKKGITNSIDLCKYLLENYHIALVPGSAFGDDRYVRFSYANSTANIAKGVKR